MSLNKEKYHKKFTIGYNGEPDFTEKVLLPFQDYISSVYAAPPEAMGMPNARKVMPGRPESLLAFREQCKQEQIEFNLLFNFDAIAFPDTMFLEQLFFITDFFKPDMVTVSNTFVMDAFLEQTEYKVNLSIIFNIPSLNQLAMVMENDFAHKIVSYNIAKSKTFSPKYIRSVREKYPELRLKLMLNEGCVIECPDQHFHSGCLSMSPRGFNVHDSLFYCRKLKPEQYWRFLTGQYIPPKFLANYCELADEFKVACRYYSSEAIAKVLSEYIHEEDISIRRAMLSSHGGAGFVFNDDALRDEARPHPCDIPYPDDFFSKRSSCGNVCHQCDYCKSILMLDV